MSNTHFTMCTDSEVHEHTHTQSLQRDGNVIFTFCTEIREAETNNIPTSSLSCVYDTRMLTLHIIEQSSVQQNLT